MVMPVFEGDALLGYVVNTAHHVDVGGAFPGSQAVQGVTEAYQEGLRVLPVRLIRKGEFDEDLLRVILGNVRIPEKVRGDLRAQTQCQSRRRRAPARALPRAGALGRCRRRRGDPGALGAAHARADRGHSRWHLQLRRRARRRRARAPSRCDFCVDVTITGRRGGGRLLAQQRSGARPASTPTSTTRAPTRLSASAPSPRSTCRTTTASSGRSGPWPAAGSFFNPEYPAASSGRANDSGPHLRRDQRRARQGAAGARDGRVLALGQSDLRRRARRDRPAMGDVRSHLRRIWRPVDKDGAEALCPVFNAANLPIEAHEANNPILFHRFELIPDSGGAGPTSRRLRYSQGRGDPVRRRHGVAAR